MTLVDNANSSCLALSVEKGLWLIVTLKVWL